MPIEIRELVIRATVSPGADRRDTAETGGQGGDAGAPPPVDVAAIVQECVRQVLQVLARDRER
jgi:hypothetical protein